MNLRIGLDIDDTICSFMGPYLERFGPPKKDCEITKNVQQVLSKDRDFWLGLPVIHRPDFTPKLYCTKRVNPKAWSRRFLERNNLPVAPIYQVLYQKASKSSHIKGKIDVFIDDSISNFIDLNLKGIPCLLMDCNYNRQWGPIGRIQSLEEEEIEECYSLFIDTLFPYFDDLVNDFRK